jgi:hypothetical protein
MKELEEMLALGIDDCGLPLEECPGPPKPKPWGAGRPCTRDVSGTALAAASSFQMRGDRPEANERQHGWNQTGFNPKAHAPTSDQQFSILSRATSMARAK